MAFGRKVIALTAKNLRIVLWRNPGPTTFTALFMPIALAVFLSLTRKLAAPPSVFGIGSATPVQSLVEALKSSGSSGTVVLVNNGHSGGDIDRVIDLVAGQVAEAGNKATRLTDEESLRDVCRSSHRGVTDCFGAVVFNASPDEGGGGGIWNYTLRADSALGHTIRVDRRDNSAEVYVLPLQRAVDAAIASLHPAHNQTTLPERTDEYPFTSTTEDELEDRTRRTFQASVVKYLAVSFIMVFIGACYHVASFMTLERETGMTELLEAMMPSTHYWEVQGVRFTSYHLSFTLVYFPGWIIASLILWRALFPTCNFGEILVYFLLCGMALVSLSILAATFFSKSQLSNVSLILYAVLGIIAQTAHSSSTATVAALSVLFTPCNFVFYIIWMAKWEGESEKPNLGRSAPNTSWTLPGVVFWVFLIIQIPLYLVIGASIERAVHGSAAKGRVNVLRPGTGPDFHEDGPPALQITNLSKSYSFGLFRRFLNSVSSSPQSRTRAVSNIDLVAETGQILALLGANGSGKSTILSCIAGIVRPSSGSIALDMSGGGVGITPQKDILWDDLTVSEHVEIFTRLKSSDHGHHDRPGTTTGVKADAEALVQAIDLSHKRDALAKTLSGGQKRKLQLGMMFAGGSKVCCVDEVSSSLDPVSRRKVWDILLRERGRRTIILTTHFLDEAELLADRVVVLSRGEIKADGSVPELKARAGNGWRVHVEGSELSGRAPIPVIPGVVGSGTTDGCTYVARTSGDAARIIEALEAAGVSDYTYEDPTLESVFFHLADEAREEEKARLGVKMAATPGTAAEGMTTRFPENAASDLVPTYGRPVGPAMQIWVLFLKRCTLLKRNWLPYLAALVLPVIAAGVTSLLIRGERPASCALEPASSRSPSTSWASVVKNEASVLWVLGPLPGYAGDDWVSQLFSPLFDNPDFTRFLLRNLEVVRTNDQFDSLVEDWRAKITPAGMWLGDSTSTPTVAYLADSGGLTTSVLGQNALDMLLTNTTIATSYKPFDSPQVPSPAKSLQLVLYMCLALSLSTAFFGLYPNQERLRGIRDLEYSNGIHPLSLWASHIAFDSLIILAASAAVTIIFASTASMWFHIGFVFVILVLYGLASTLLAYVASLLAASQSATFGAATGIQGFGTLIYFIAYSLVSSFAAVNKVDGLLLVVHFVISLFAPIGSVMRALFVALNLNSIACAGSELSRHPGILTMYGGPILCLMMQSAIAFALLVFADSSAGARLAQRLSAKPKTTSPKSTTHTTDCADASNKDIAAAREESEITPYLLHTQSSSPVDSAATSGLVLSHLSKTLRSTPIVSSLSLAVPTDTIFTLLGLNGAGKSVTLSMIRGLLLPDRTKPPGDILVAGHSVVTSAPAARRHLGVCPQSDALDAMSVQEHVAFYARIRGVPRTRTDDLLRAVGLRTLRARNASELSGGEKRKLSLVIALLGDPDVVLLDEPTCGLDVVAKRAVWDVVRQVGKGGRAVLMTSHSMEEAEALAGRVGILAGPGKMVVVGAGDDLQRSGGKVVLHVVVGTAEAAAARFRRWVQERWPTANTSGGLTHGRQLRVTIPAAEVGNGRQKAVALVVVEIEKNKAELGISHYSVRPSTLDELFLKTIGDNWQGAEGVRKEDEKKRRWFGSR